MPAADTANHHEPPTRRSERAGSGRPLAPAAPDDHAPSAPPVARHGTETPAAPPSEHAPRRCGSGSPGLAAASPDPAAAGLANHHAKQKTHHDNGSTCCTVVSMHGFVTAHPTATVGTCTESSGQHISPTAPAVEDAALVATRDTADDSTVSNAVDTATWTAPSQPSMPANGCTLAHTHTTQHEPVKTVGYTGDALSVRRDFTDRACRAGCSAGP